MVRIVQLLFAATLLATFSYLLIFTSLSRAGNGGKYWGFDGQIERRIASQESFDAGDYRFLAVEVREPGAITQVYTPRATPCLHRPSAKSVQTRRAVVNMEVGDRKPHIAWDFADEYNEKMTELLSNDWNFGCEQPID
jgi:hypothetical protein